MALRGGDMAAGCSNLLAEPEGGKAAGSEQRIRALVFFHCQEEIIRQPDLTPVEKGQGKQRHPQLPCHNFNQEWKIRYWSAVRLSALRELFEQRLNASFL
ncbi:receptor expression-enhancing protein 2 [Platysternon megacephalum]|uniref:Receptor expression-enhancing protein 2 n=1 Tax=Platysternon megacephalum TaxID=55544 RepID=A0A4D9DVD8_9SAUR|nr:receptor expression-enhancing protein 2 [Platysternon megacephalum]